MLSQSQGYGALVGIRGRAWVMYTVFRVLFLAVAWLLIQVTTPIRGVWAIALAIVISAVFSILLLGRQRDAIHTVRHQTRFHSCAAARQQRQD